MPAPPPDSRTPRPGTQAADLTAGTGARPARQVPAEGADTPPARELDAIGLLCPLPVLRARKRLLAMAPGEVLCVLASDPAALIDLPHFCAEAGHEFLGVEERPGPAGHEVRAYRIRRGTRAPDAEPSG